MFELPELLTLAKQMNETIQGKTIKVGTLGNSPHKFVWYNRKPDEFTQLSTGKIVREAHVKGRWLLIALEKGYTLVLGECGGRIQYHPAGTEIPKKYHLWLAFEDGSALTVMTQMWGAMELFEAGQERERKYIKDMRITPVDPEFSFDYFSGLIRDLLQGEKRSVKSLLTQDQLIPGLGNAIAQDIMFHAHLHPRHSLVDLTIGQQRDLYAGITDTIDAVTEKGGRNDEVDLFGNPGGYLRIMDSKAAGKPCPDCGRKIEKIQYLGGACYFCPRCQV
ncbi:MAG TPA: DNA-formamidopyrimidine glycosylase family protein [Anaerolineales bacterium]|nr:DNA-formamidopyrimidine glycosylase family protein [Anaerolineales bacterium]